MSPECNDTACQRVSRKAIRTLGKGKSEALLDPRFGGFAFNFSREEAPIHYEHIRERAAEFLGETLKLETRGLPESQLGDQVLEIVLVRDDGMEVLSEDQQYSTRMLDN